MARERQGAKSQLLAALPEPDRVRLERLMHPVKLNAWQVLSEPGERLRYTYFPETCVISLMSVMREGKAIEVGTIGREGMTGMSCLIGVDAVGQRFVSQVPGTALRMKTSDLLEAARPDSPAWRLFMRYSVAFAHQLMQGVACAKFHSVDKRCCRWLITTQDRAGSDRFDLTHELLSLMLGTRRVSVSQALKKLRDRGLIDYRRGTIAVLNRPALEARACECYGIVDDMYRRLVNERR